MGLIPWSTSEPSSENLRAALDRMINIRSLVLADDPAVREPQLATYLAALNPTWTIFDWSPTTRGVADEPIMERLYPFGLTTEAPSSLPVDSWERAARVVHEQYRLIMQRNGTLDPTSRPPAVGAARPVPQGDQHPAGDDGAGGCRDLGRSWGPVVEGVSSDGLVTTRRGLGGRAGPDGQDGA